MPQNNDTSAAGSRTSRSAEGSTIRTALDQLATLTKRLNGASTPTADALREDLRGLKALLERGISDAAEALESEIQEHQRTVDALRESEERFRAMADSAPVLIWMTDERGSAVYFNRRWLDFTGRPAGEQLGDGWHRCLHDEDRARVLAECAAAFEAQRDFRVECRLRRTDDEPRWMLFTGSPRITPDGAFAGYIGSGVDIALEHDARDELARHRDRLEGLVAERTAELEASHRQLRMADRMAAIGTLAAGLGHDMGNLLLPLRCGLDTLQAADLSQNLQENVRAMRQAADYLQALTNGLHLLAQDPQDAEATGAQTDLRAWWPDVAALLKYSLPKKVFLENRIPAGLAPAAVAPHRLTQVVLNIVGNAGEALSATGKGRVVVQAEPADDGDAITLTIADDGPGMPDAVRERAMDPSFTTHRAGSPSGMGLSLVHGIVKESGGSVDIASTPGEGTTVRLTLRAVRQAPPTQAPARENLIAAVSVEDKRIGAYLSALLDSMGFEVRHTPPADPGAASLWITEHSPDALAAARRYVKGESGRRVLVVGDAPGDWESLGAVKLDRSCRLGAIRAALAGAGSTN